MAANLILVNSFQALNSDQPATTASAIYINPARIISVKTRATAYLTTGITDVLYAVPVNNSELQVTLIVTQTAAAVNTAANASTTPA